VCEKKEKGREMRTALILYTMVRLRSISKAEVKLSLIINNELCHVSAWGVKYSATHS
jgi:hypothetical protein